MLPLTKVAGRMRSGWRESFDLLPLLLLAAAYCCSLLRSILNSSAGARLFGAVYKSAEKRRGYSDEQDHNDYLYARRTRHCYSLCSM